MKTDKVIQIGNLIEESKFSNPQVGRVYSTDGISRTIDTMRGGRESRRYLFMMILTDKWQKTITLWVR